jgi:hypothetical protein
MFGQWCEVARPLCELLLPLEELALGVVAVLVVEVPLVVLEELDALAIAAPPPTAAPAIASIVTRVAILRRILASPPFCRPT